jgi:predicted extracellular nuclease
MSEQRSFWYKWHGGHGLETFVIHVFLAYLLLLAPSCCAQNHPDEKGYIIAFYNVQNLFHPDDDPHTNDNDFTPEGSKNYTVEVYSDRIRRIGEVIGDMDNSLNGELLMAGLTEVENEQVLTDLCEDGLPAGFRYIHNDSPDPRGIDVAFIYRENLFFPDTQFVVRINEPYIPGKGTPRTRDILYVIGRTASERFIVAVNHWPSRRGGVTKTEHKRIHTANICKRITDSLSKELPGHSIILMGDFNDNPGDKSLKELVRTDENSGEQGTARLHNPFIKLFEEGHGSYVYNNKWNMYDQILSSGSVNVIRAGTFTTPGMLIEEGSQKGYPKRSYRGDSYINGYSDHLPVYIIIE